MSFRPLSSAKVRLFGNQMLIAEVNGHESWINLNCYYGIRSIHRVGYKIPEWKVYWAGEQDRMVSSWGVDSAKYPPYIYFAADEVYYNAMMTHHPWQSTNDKLFWLNLSERFWIKDGKLVAEDKDVAERAMEKERQEDMGLKDLFGEPW